MRRGDVVVLSAAVLHAYWGLILLIYASAALGATPVAGLYERVPSARALGALLIAASSTAAIAVVVRSGTMGLVLLLPQQMALLISLWSSVAASVAGMYADATVVPGGWKHVSVDQAPMIVWVLAHAYVYFKFYGREAPPDDA